MYKELWRKAHGSVCQISFFDANGIKISSYTGFKSEGHIVTDEVVLKMHRAFEAEIRFVNQDCFTPLLLLRIPISEFRKRILPRPKSMYNHIVLLRTDFPDMERIKDLSLADSFPEPGQSAAVLGFQWDHCSLSIKHGIISSHCHHHGKPYMQFEVSVKQGNSGAPLMNAETGEVVGVVGYRLAERTKSFQKIKDVVDENVEVLETALDKWKIDDIDPVQVLIANQKLIKHFATDIYKSANVRIGFATPASEIMNYLKINNQSKSLMITKGI